MSLQALQEMVNQDMNDQMEQKGFESRLELAAPPEVAILQILNVLKLVGKDQEKSGWADWTRDIGKKMQDFAGGLMEKIGPTEREAIDIETDRNLVDDARFNMDVYKSSHEGWDEETNGRIDWEDDFGFIGASVHNEYNRAMDAKSKDRHTQEFKCKRIVIKGLGTLVDVMRMLPEDQATHIFMEEKNLEGLDIDPKFIHDSDIQGVKTVIVPGKTRSQMFSSEEMSLLIPMGTGAKGHSYVELTPDMWQKISFGEMPTTTV